MKLAKEWLNTDGRIKTLSKSTVTEDRYPVEKFVCTKQKGMKDAWYPPILHFLKLILSSVKRY